MAETELTQVAEERRMTASFKGYQRYKRIEEGAFSDCLNMTSEEAPCAMVRARRGDIVNQYCYDDGSRTDIRYLPAQVVDCITHGGKLAYLTTHTETTQEEGQEPKTTRYYTVMCGTHRWEKAASLNSSAKLLSFGHGLFSPANNLYIPDVLDDGSRGVYAYSILCKFDVSPCDEDGNVYEKAATPPEDPNDGDLYYKTGENAGLYRYNADTQEWASWPITFVRLTPTAGTGVSAAFDLTLKMAAMVQMLYVQEGDVINITGESDDTYSVGGIRAEKVLKSAAGDEASGIVIKTPLPPIDKVKLRIEKRIPKLDHAVVHDNRVWGCRYGENDKGDYVNEIYASELGNPCNWLVGDGTEADPFTATVGEEGNWTGAAVVGDNVVFFKENCMYTVYGDSPSNYRVQIAYCDGIAADSAKSAVSIGGALYYLSPHGVMRLYSGTLPQQISDELIYGGGIWGGLAGTDGRKYFLRALHLSEMVPKFFVYDTELKEWHIEDAVPAVAMPEFCNNLVAISSEDTVTDRTTVYDVRICLLSVPDAFTALSEGYTYLCFYDETAHKLVYPDDEDYYEGDISHRVAADHFVEEASVQWYFVTGNYGHEAPDYKRVKGISIRAWCDTDASFQTEIMYDDDGQWRELKASETFSAGETGTNRVDYRLRRCDLFRLRISGQGRVCVYSITTTYEGSGDRNYGNNQI